MDRTDKQGRPKRPEEQIKEFEPNWHTVTRAPIEHMISTEQPNDYAWLILGMWRHMHM